MATTESFLIYSIARPPLWPAGTIHSDSRWQVVAALRNGVNCGQPSLSENGLLLVFVKAEAG